MILEEVSHVLQRFSINSKKEYDIVLPIIGRKTICDNMQGFSEGYNSENEWYFLADGSAIRFPYRVYYADEDSVYNELSATEKLVSS